MPEWMSGNKDGVKKSPGFDRVMETEREAQFLERRGYVNDARLLRTRQFIHSVATRSFPSTVAPPETTSKPPLTSTSPDFTIEAQAKLLRKILKHGIEGWDIYLSPKDNLLSLDGDIPLTEDEAALARLILRT